mmetsp:Transcript_2636/g.5514  ORF Transcript_2636/g.5514 Transcript_2636/m.5514 type:complete len:298 (-) Transcript_2636:90-983(-)
MTTTESLYHELPDAILSDSLGRHQKTHSSPDGIDVGGTHHQGSRDHTPLIPPQRSGQGNGRHDKRRERSLSFLHRSPSRDHPLPRPPRPRHRRQNGRRRLLLPLSDAFPFRLRLRRQRGIRRDVRVDPRHRWLRSRRVPRALRRDDPPSDDVGGGSGAIGCGDRIVGGNDAIGASKVGAGGDGSEGAAVQGGQTVFGRRVWFSGGGGEDVVVVAGELLRERLGGPSSCGEWRGGRVVAASSSGTGGHGAFVGVGWGRGRSSWFGVRVSLCLYRVVWRQGRRWNRGGVRGGSRFVSVE